ncbi:MAG: 5-formyltetrahydrofolate cyclo-ligase [Robiginitomaculum sp.]
MAFDSLEKTRARNAAKMIRFKVAAERPDAGVELIKYWPDLGQKDGIVAVYLPIKTEIDSLPLMGALQEAGYRLALPCIKGAKHPLEFRRYCLGDKLRGGAYNTREPLQTTPIVEPDIVLLPLLSYSGSGMRLGYGGGFYDRSLLGLRSRKQIFACGLAFSGQEAAIVPTGPYDQVLDGILTETGFRKFGQK